jgi:hypothetical protein
VAAVAADASAVAEAGEAVAAMAEMTVAAMVDHDG